MSGPTVCTFANTILSMGFDFTFGPGVQPSVCILTTVPHVPNLPSVGTLTFQTVGQAPFVFRDCLVEQPRLSATESGQIWQLPVKDRRWAWQFGYIHGSYNRPRPNGSLIREKTPQELAGLLLDAMGETGYDVSRLPNQTRPEKVWEGALPAAELDALCASLGCIVVLNPMTDRVEIWQEGEGVPLPNRGLIRGAAYAPVLPAQPLAVRVEGGPTLFQSLFKLEAVGLDTDGRWKPIDSLSYRPASGWSVWPPIGFPLIPDTATYTLGGRVLKVRDLAEATVYRCYRITGLANGGWAPPLLQGTQFAPTSLKDLRLFPELADEEISTVDGGLRRLPAVVYAKYWREKNHRNTTTQERYPHGFSFDTAHGIIQFGEPLFLSGPVRPAEVRLECAFHAGAGGVFHRHSVEANTGSAAATPVRLVQRPDVSARVIYRYANDNTFTTTDDISSTTSRLNFWKDAALAEYGLLEGGTVNFQHLVPISPTGLTQQITWSGGGKRPARTIVSQAQRHRRTISTMDSYRDRLAARRVEQQLQNLLTTQFAVRAIAGSAV